MSFYQRSARRGLEIGWKLASLRKKPSNKMICPICGLEFDRRGKRKNGFKLVCCSRECKSKQQIGKRIFGFNVKPKFGKVITCKVCGKKVQPPPSQSKRKYCSMQCCRSDPFFWDGIRGSNHYNWKGGVSPKNQVERKSIKAKNWVKSVFKRDNYTCNICKCRGRKLQAHHHRGWATHPHLRFDINNGITLCKRCHKMIHSWQKRLKDEEQELFNRYGTLV